MRGQVSICLYHDLFHPFGAVLTSSTLLISQGQAQLQTKMAFRPASLLSKSHRQLTAALDKRHVKVNRVQHTVTVLDPKKAKADREREEEGRIKSR